MKHLNTYITEYIIKKKLENPIDSEDHYDYYPETKEELKENIEELVNKGIYNFNCIDTSAITDMSHLFDMSEKLIKHNLKNVNFNISNWDVSNVTNMQNMFMYCNEFNCDLSNWDVSNVTNMNSVFYCCVSFTGKGLENWNVSNVENMEGMFYGCNSLKNIPSWYKK